MRLLFIPEVIQPMTNERTPKIRDVIAENHTVWGVRDRIVKHVYDQGKPRILRYVMYFVNHVYLFWLSLRIARKNDVDIVFCEGPHYAMVGVLVSKILRKSCVWDSHGNTLIFCEQLGKSKIYTAASVAVERILGKQATALITVSERDKRAYRDMGIDEDKIFVIPTCVDFSMVSSSSRTPEEIRTELGVEAENVLLLFFGALDYAPNKEAFDYINDFLAPEMARECPEVRICVAGRGDVPPETHRLVTCTGFVPNIYDLIRASDVCIAPLWSGVGILTKVLDMMACGKPTVVTPLAKDGIPELIDNWNVVLASDRKDFVERTMQMLKNRDTHSMLGKRGKETVERAYTWDKARIRLEDLFSRVIQSQNGLHRPVDSRPNN